MIKKSYLKLTDDCQTKARRINKTGITGRMSTIGENGAYASGSFASTISKCAIKFALRNY
jgi:uncharacterized protein YkwD